MSADVKHAMDEEGRELSRYDIAARMSNMLHREVTKSTIDNWTAASNNTGRPMVEWEIHNTDGQNLDPNKTVAENGLVDGSRVFLNLKVGAGGEC